MSAPRLAPVPKEAWGDDERAALVAGFGEAAAARFLDAPDAPRIPNVLGTLVHHPRLAGRFLAYNSVLLRDPVLDARQRELMILRVAWRTRCKYEWVQHVRIARAAGITDAEIEAIRTGASARTWVEVDALLLRATDELLDDHVVGDETWSQLAQHLDERQLVELVFVAGTYSCLAMAFNSFGLELDPELADVDASTAW